MRIPLRWLSEYVDLTLSPEELAERLTIAGVEVADTITTAGQWDGIRVGQVVEVTKHPNADRLSLATVDLGGGERHTVVCGAPNVAAGQKVAFASVGARLIDGHTGKPTVLKPAVIRGVQSAGMVCSEKELGLSEDHQGILVLDDAAPVGAPLASVLGETIFDLDLTPNRPDLLSVLGVAREVAALTGQTVRDPSTEYAAAGPPIKGKAAVEVQAPDLCPRYVAALIENVKIGDSPRWMQERLIATGMRPINNIVDITNYVMLEMGQPLHAFDFKKLRGGKIIVRRARPGERMTLLDGSVHELSEDMLVIADAEEAVAVAGVMGGANSEVGPKTTSVLLESANFSGPSIRRTSQALKIRTDASVRFEKGLSRHLPIVAAQRAVKLMVDLCGGRAAQGLIDIASSRGKELRIGLTQERLHRILGTSLPVPQVRQILGGLGFGCRWVPPDRFVVRVPYWRTDVTIPDDVIEEVARVIGYDQLPTRTLRGEIPLAQPQPIIELRERVRDILSAAGMQEVINYSLTNLHALTAVLGSDAVSARPPLRVANPMSREFEYLRTTLRHSVLGNLATNIPSNPGLIALFEVGRVYLPQPDELPREVETLCGAVTGRKPDRWGQPTGEPAGFYDAKAFVERLFVDLRIEADFQDAVDVAFLPGRTAAITVGGQCVGVIGQLHPRVVAAFDIKADVAMFEIDLEALLPHISPVAHFRAIPTYPSVQQDLAVVVDEAVPAARVLSIIRSFPLVRAASIFDVYTGPPIPSGRKSIAFSVSFGSDTRTLADKDVRKERDRIIARLRQELQAELRA